MHKSKQRREDREKESGGRREGDREEGNEETSHFTRQIIKISYSQSVINSKYRTLKLTIVCMIVKLQSYIQTHFFFFNQRTIFTLGVTDRRITGSFPTLVALL